MEDKDTRNVGLFCGFILLMAERNCEEPEQTPKAIRAEMDGH